MTHRPCSYSISVSTKGWPPEEVQAKPEKSHAPHFGKRDVHEKIFIAMKIVCVHRIEAAAGYVLDLCRAEVLSKCFFKRTERPFLKHAGIFCNRHILIHHPLSSIRPFTKRLHNFRKCSSYAGQYKKRHTNFRVLTQFIGNTTQSRSLSCEAAAGCLSVWPCAGTGRDLPGD